MNEAAKRWLRLAVRVFLRGFLTLLALLLLVAIFAPGICLHSPGKARMAMTRSDVTNIASALDLFRLDTGRYPTTEEGLAVLVAPTPQLEAEGKYRKGGYMDRPPVDPWGNPYRYQQPGCHNPQGFDLWSYGMDGVAGGEGEAADIGNWDVPMQVSARHGDVFASRALVGSCIGLVIGLPFYIGGVIFRLGERKPLRQALAGLHLAALIYMAGVGAVMMASGSIMD